MATAAARSLQAQKNGSHGVRPWESPIVFFNKKTEVLGDLA